MLFEIYAGLSGGFGGASHQETDEFNSEEEALEHAYHLAIEEYQSYEGCHGILDWLDCREDLIKSGFSYNDDDVDARYQEEIESWIEYYVEPAKDE